ncbi:YaiI/YqxD family protein [Methylorubrum sp. Q1]|uniref:YaiI/YqxD family protein n=1 Tax=Methylorubrum sp. Q1 TaxID=2562453 RepID=UPI0010768D45|nr:YaiI/YqxD family protein [Methylorubrum sp. Q1]TFZ58457.1 YaiI/YqxD family protein [Methylorubrum sp. Q1]
MSEEATTPRIAIYVDADACPVKDEVYRVAGRYGLHVFVVSNSFLNLPREPWIERVVVGDKFDAADDWIAERASRGAIVITADVPLASRCAKAGAVALAPNGKAFTESSVGLALATRNLMQDLREAGAITGGPRPFSPKDRSAFLGALDRVVMRLKRDLKL